MRNSKLIRLVIIESLILVVALVALGMLYSSYVKYDGNIESTIAELEARTSYAYVAVVDIPAGATVSDAVTMSKIIINDECSDYASEEALNKSAVANIAAGSVIYNSMLYEPEEVKGNISDYNVIEIPDSLLAGNKVDICVRFRNGSDYVVVSKVTVHGLERGSNTLSLILTEQQRQYLLSAMVDCTVYNATLYATVYTNPELQPSKAITYVPRDVTVELLQDANQTDLKNKRRVLERQIGEN